MKRKVSAVIAAMLTFVMMATTTVPSLALDATGGDSGVGVGVRVTSPDGSVAEGIEVELDGQIATEMTAGSCVSSPDENAGAAEESGAESRDAENLENLGHPEEETSRIESGSDICLQETFEPVVVVNPIYADVVEPGDIAFAQYSEEEAGEALVGSSSETILTTEAEFAEAYRDAFDEMLADWGTQFSLEFMLTSDEELSGEQIGEYYGRLQDIGKANQFIHNGNPTLGDYGKYHCAGYGSGGGYYTGYSEESGYYAVITLRTEVTYFTTPEQEAEETVKFNEVMNSLELDGKTEYGKIKAIYDYICGNVVYDYEHLEDDSYTLKYSSYAALMNGTAVCQGYANLFYRMALAAGLDARIIAGYGGDGGSGGGGPHAWNIVRLKGLYYNMDTTWDAGYDEYGYFLKGADTFELHVRSAEFDTEEFHTEYPMATSDYVVVPEDLETVTPTPTPSPKPTATSTPTPKPTATSTPTPKPTATNTPTPKPTATNTPTPKPTATSTPTPKPTKTPTPSPKPTATNTPTPKPTATSTPSPTPMLLNIHSASIAGVSLSYGYSGKAYTPKVTVRLNNVTLTEGVDYTVEYSNNINPGTASVTLTGIGKYTGTKVRTFEIVDCVSVVEAGKTYQLIPKNNSATAVSAFAGRMTKNTRVYITNRSSSEAMKFVAVKNSDNSWKFINAKCELALAVQQNSSEAGKGLVLYDQTSKKAQNWKLSRKSDNSFAITNALSGLYMAMSDASAPKGTTLSIMENSGRGDQRFYIVETSAVDASFDGTYSVRASKNKAFGLNVASSSKTDGANVNLYKYSNVNAKKFKAMYSGGGYYRLVNVNSGLVLTVKGNTKANGANVIQSAWAGQSGQRWKITRNADGTVTLKNALGTVLHLNGNKAANGTNVVAKSAATTGAQKWYLQ